MRNPIVSKESVDLRTQSCADAVSHVERSLGVRLDREAAVVKRRSVGARTDRGTWVRIETQRLEDLGTRGWNGVETSSVLSDVAKPAWFQGFSWTEEGHGRMWRAATVARNHMDAADDEPGRFGFDRAELAQHLAESSLRLGETTRARNHAENALRMKPTGSAGWAAVTVTLARAAAAERNPADATTLATTVLDAISPTHLRETTRRRLAALDDDLQAERRPAGPSRDFHDRLRTLPAHTPPQRTSPEPNGH